MCSVLLLVLKNGESKIVKFIYCKSSKIIPRHPGLCLSNLTIFPERRERILAIVFETLNSKHKQAGTFPFLIFLQLAMHLVLHLSTGVIFKI